MSQRWLKFLKKFGSRGKNYSAYVGEEDLEGLLTNPKMMGRYDVLFQLYGPLLGSPWVPYHCPTLFASIDRLGIAPTKAQVSASYHAERPAEAWQWLGPKTMLLVDLPGETVIEAGVLLMKQGAQPISTFDHWPSTASRMTVATAVIDARQIIDMMFTLALEVYEARKNLRPDSAPMWLCDSRRLGSFGNQPTPGTFDNRYYIDDSILPGINTLKKAGIRHVIYLNMTLNDEVPPDLAPLFIEADKEGMSIERVALEDESTWIQPVRMEVPFKTNLPIHSFRRTDMGGFGRMVPVPSEGSYSSGGGGG